MSLFQRYDECSAASIPADPTRHGVTRYLCFSVMTSVAPSVFPQILLDMELQDIESRVQRKKAAVGEPLRWEIETYGNISPIGEDYNRSVNM